MESDIDQSNNSSSLNIHVVIVKHLTSRECNQPTYTHTQFIAFQHIIHHPQLYPAADIQIIFRNRFAPNLCPLFLANTHLGDLGAMARSRVSLVIVIERLLEV